MSRVGSIYFLANHDASVIKVGFATDLDTRLASLQTGNHSDLSLLYSFDGSKDCEALFHASLADSRIRGEWFSYTGFVDALICEIEEFRDHKAGPLWPHEVTLLPAEISLCINSVPACPVAEVPPIPFRRSAQ